MGRNTRFARTASEDDLTQADVAFMFADNEDMASLPATTTTTATATTTTDTVGTALSSSSSPNSPGSGLYTAASTFTTTATTTTTGAASATAAPTKPAKRAPRSQHTAPPELPATAAQVIDLASFSNLVTALATTIVKAVQDGKSVTAPNKRLIILAAEETRRAMAAFERVTAATSSSQPNATSVAPPAPPAPSARNTMLGPPAAAPPILADEANSSLKRELAACVRAEFGKLKAELSQDVRRAAARAPSGPTYAQMARTQHQPQPQQQQQQQHQQQQRAAAPFNAPPPIRATRPAIVVSTKATATSRQQTVEAFRRSISFRASNYAPARVQPVSHNKLRVEFDTDQQRDDALLRLGDASEVTAEPARTLRPMLILKGINKSTPSNELVDIVRRQNNCMDGELALKFERKNRNENLYSAVLVASSDIWRKLVGMGRVCVDHQRVHVERFSPFVQCFACLQFGHVRKNCVPTAPKPCAHCASTTHQEPDCPVKSDKNNLKCYNCNNRNTKYNNNDPINHKATSGSCSVLRAMRTRVESRVDYGLP